MTKRNSLGLLQTTLRELTDTVRDLAVTVDDRPDGSGEPAVVEALRTRAAAVEEDLGGTSALVRAAADAESTGDPRVIARRLAAAHDRFGNVTRKIRFELAAQPNLFEIEHLGTHGGTAWRKWSELVLHQLEQTDDAACRVGNAIVGCWEEIVD